MNAVFSCLIVGGGHDSAAFAGIRIGPHGQRKSAKAWRVTLFHRRVKGIHVEMGDDAHRTIVIAGVARDATFRSERVLSPSSPDGARAPLGSKQVALRSVRAPAGRHPQEINLAQVSIARLGVNYSLGR